MILSLIATAVAAATPQCGTIDAALPAHLASWRNAKPIAGSIRPGRTFAMALKPSPQLEYKSPGGQAKPDSFGGFAPLRIDQAGRYGVAFSHAAWIDVTRGKDPALQSVGHGHGPPCTSIRKIVDFDLKAGTYMLQITESPAARVKVLVIRR